MLDAVRHFHSLARHALAESKPDQAAGHMRDARKMGRKAARYVDNQDLRQRIASDAPMSKEEWERFCGPSDFDG
jgi:hypothetical protein